MRKKGTKNKKPNMVHITLRVPEWVHGFFMKKGGGTYTVPMREALEHMAGRTKK